MSIVDKLKNLLKPELDNELEDNPVEERIDEIAEEQLKPEKDEYQFEETFKFPVVFEEEDLIDDFEVVAEEEKQTPYVAPKREPRPEPLIKKPFKPSPIISPVYGIIDGQIPVVKPNTNLEIKITERETEKVTFDTVRQKAYGSLEEEIENVINDGTDIFFDLEEEEEIEDSIVSEFIDDQSDLSEKTIASAMDDYEYRGVAVDTKKKPKIEEVQDLVDAMYEEEGE